MKCLCSYCGKENEFSSGKVNRAKKMNLNIYCNRKCAGLGRRVLKSDEQKKEDKRLYDIQYRIENKDKIIHAKSEYHKRTYDPTKAAEIRKKRAPKHLEYCRTKKYKKWKKEYDKKHRAKKNYGEYWESCLLLQEIECQYDNREVKQQNNLINKSQNRKKLWNKMQNLMQKI